MTAPTAPNDCPTPPASFSDSRSSLSTLILHEACETAGGVAPLATLLGVPARLLNRWLDGEEPPPESIYQACIDIVLLHE
jgi:hypothetical protein